MTYKKHGAAVGVDFMSIRSPGRANVRNRGCRASWLLDDIRN